MTAQAIPTDVLAAFDMFVRILIVDDHPLFREALQNAVHLAYPDAEVIEATTVAGAHEIISANRDINLMLLDLSLPGVQGMDGLLAIKTQFPRIPVVIVSGMEDSRIVHEALTFGAAGFIPKSVRKPELAAAIKMVMNGFTFVPEGFEAPEKTPLRPGQLTLAEKLAQLTPQQLRVLMMLRQGKLNKQIAHELDVGETTVKAHVSEILRKLSVASRTQAVIEVSRIEFDNILGGDKTAEKH